VVSKSYGGGYVDSKNVGNWYGWNTICCAEYDSEGRSEVKLRYDVPKSHDCYADSKVCLVLNACDKGYTSYKPNIKVRHRLDCWTDVGNYANNRYVDINNSWKCSCYYKLFFDSYGFKVITDNTDSPYGYCNLKLGVEYSKSDLTWVHNVGKVDGDGLINLNYVWYTCSICECDDVRNTLWNAGNNDMYSRELDNVNEHDSGCGGCCNLNANGCACGTGYCNNTKKESSQVISNCSKGGWNGYVYGYDFDYNHGADCSNANNFEHLNSSQVMSICSKGGWNLYTYNYHYECSYGTEHSSDKHDGLCNMNMNMNEANKLHASAVCYNYNNSEHLDKNQDNSVLKNRWSESYHSIEFEVKINKVGLSDGYYDPKLDEDCGKFQPIAMHLNCTNSCQNYSFWYSNFNNYVNSDNWLSCTILTHLQYQQQKDAEGADNNKCSSSENKLYNESKVDKINLWFTNVVVCDKGKIEFVEIGGSIKGQNFNWKGASTYERSEEDNMKKRQKVDRQFRGKQQGDYILMKWTILTNDDYDQIARCHRGGRRKRSEAGKSGGEKLQAANIRKAGNNYSMSVLHSNNNNGSAYSAVNNALIHSENKSGETT